MTTQESFDLAEQQQAFVGLLGRPLVTPDNDAELHRLVSRHRDRLALWCERLGYRLVTVGTAFRVRRRPGPARPNAVPAAAVPDRRELALTLVVAAVLEDVRTDSVSIQTLSDATRDLTAVNHLTPYDPIRRADRKRLVAAVGRLTDHGVLRRRTQDEMLDAWQDSGEGPGAGYTINRNALMLLVDPADLAATVDQPADEDPDTAQQDAAQQDQRAHLLLRRLVETQALDLTALTDTERAYWRNQRHRLFPRATQMTGGTVEEHAEVAILLLPTDNAQAQAVTIDFPAASGAHWVSLKLLDEAARQAHPDPAGRLRWPAARVDAACRHLLDEVGPRLPIKLRESATAIRVAAEDTLGPVGLLDVDPDGGWCLTPLAARYRAADLTVPPRPEELRPEELRAEELRPEELRPEELRPGDAPEVAR